MAARTTHGGLINNEWRKHRDVCVALQTLKSVTGVEPLADRARVLPRPALLAAAAGMVVVVTVLAGMNVPWVGDWARGSRGLPAIESIVALPSTVRADEDDAYLADAIPKTISAYLTEIEGLDTMLPPTSLEVEGVGGDLDRITEAYGASALVVSSVVTQADRLFLNLQLVEVGSRRLVWSQEYEGARSNYLELVRRAADDLRRRVGSRPR